MATLPEKTLVDMLHGAIQDSVRVIADQEIKKAQEEIEKRVKQEVGAIAIRVAQWAEVHMLQDRLVIEVKMEQFKR